MAKNVRCCYCQNLEIRLDEDRVPFDWCEKVVDSPDPQRIRECKYYEKIDEPTEKVYTVREKPTNADRIRGMTDEELAEFICSEYFVPHCPIPTCKNDDDDCVECWLSWLKEPVKGAQDG